MSAIALLLVGVAVVAGIERLDRHLAERTELQTIELALQQHGHGLQKVLGDIVDANRELAAGLAAHPDWDRQAFSRMVEVLVATQPRIASVVVTREFKVVQVHPERGNESVIGLDYTLHPEFMASIKRAIASRDTVLDGPVALLQSGRPGLIVRTAFFDQGTQGAPGRFLGVVSMAIDLEGLLTGVGLLDPARPFTIALRRGAEDGQVSEVAGDSRIFFRRHAAVSLNLPDGRWDLGGVPKADLASHHRGAFVIRTVGAAVIVLLLAGLLRRAGVLGDRRDDDQGLTQGRVSLRTLLLVGVLIPTPLLVGTSVWLSYNTSLRAAEQLEQRQVAELAREVRDKVTHFFDVPRRVVSYNAEQFREGMLDVQDKDTMLRNFLMQLRQQPLLTFLSMGTDEGEYFAASRPPLGVDRNLRILKAARADGREMRLYRVEDGNRAGDVLSVGNLHFDARTRPWYRAAVAENSIRWYPAYRYVIDDVQGVYDAMGMGMSVPLYDPQRRFIGVLTADVALSQLSGYLKTQMAGIGGIAFLVEEGGALLATSVDDPIYRIDGSQTLRIRAVDSDNASVRQLGRAMAGTAEGNRFITVDGARYLIDWQTLRLPDGPALTIAMAVPEARFAAPAEASLRTMGYLVLLFCSLGVIIALFATRWLAQPVLALSHWARALGAGDLKASPPEPSAIRELAILTHTLVSMTGRIRQQTEELECRVAERTEALEQANRRLAVQSVTDGLTGIANRRRFDQFFATECARASRTRQALSVMMIDVDLFKAYNDHHGHLAGDEALKQIAKVLAGHARRPGDLAARYGGEEFVLVAAETGRGEALQLAETIRAAVEALALPHATAPLGVITISVGVAVVEGEPLPEPDRLLGVADQALYRAKAAGRNRVELA